jgi:hypothetical protein
MSEETQTENKHVTNITASEILFGIMLGIAAIWGIWISSSFLVHLLEYLKFS